ncbi:MAG: hypothetical protein DCC43_13555 [Candidatus Brocadia sp.]|uniref:Cytochrome c n=1 Tax=Candidatus Brocadia fulgida TaxID=380242 RepID=A0A0M2UVL7_9BACT|nr:MAG: hypothetical protein BROFUL_02742 [Candidatus Brocadia fulgida]MCC6324151.1 hypothetical protein [Candidatus Brocadia sp.]MCE7912843.1 hypothetical protein [Candidatus Brocadia sp. AMX3]MDG5998137.1 hypothetical protein [Candidatus Brocadia sp.]RIJ92572.1 MAG: hypothetical protein DCC43_13555 [Candidatus Brocadia sp.]
MTRNSIFAGLVAVICLVAAHSFAEEKPKGEKEKSELAKIMGEIDKSYKAVEQISGYYKYSDNDWSVIAEASANIVQLAKVVISKFPRPDDKKYQDLNKLMLTEAEKMLEVTSHKNERGALEDAQWQVRRLRQTCAVCHKHLGIHLYPQLYPGKKDELQPGQEEIPAPKETGAPKDW